jgi:hypothetical protein
MSFFDTILCCPQSRGKLSLRFQTRRIKMQSERKWGGGKIIYGVQNRGKNAISPLIVKMVFIMFIWTSQYMNNIHVEKSQYN